MSFYSDIFVVRFWKESRGNSSQTKALRGVVEHVHTGEKRYVVQLDQVSDFINRYIDDEGTAVDRWEGSNKWKKLKRWLDACRAGLSIRSGMANGYRRHDDGQKPEL